MKARDAVIKYLEREPFKRDVGHYWASEIGSIMGGYVKASDWGKPNPIIDNAEIVCEGMAKENMLASIFQKANVNCACGDKQNKYLLEVAEGVTITTKPDFEFPTQVWETKDPLNWCDYEVIKPSYRYQLECEARAVPNKKVFLGYFVPKRIIPVLVEYHSDDKLWEQIKTKLINFNKQLQKCQQ
jgi:hypothetical protein